VREKDDMTIYSITLQNFRCFNLNKFEFSNLTYICGGNGSGKTAILEAISLINGQNSFRAKTMENLIKNEVGNFEVMAETIHGNVFIQHDSSKKSMELDGEKTTAHQLKKLFCPVLYSPQHELSLTTAVLARGLIDKLASHLFVEHEKLLNKCKELLSERIKILLLSGNGAWLNSIEEQIAQNLTVIFYNRLIFTKKINNFCIENSIELTIYAENKFIQMLNEKQTFSSVEKQIVQDLQNTRNIDRDTNRNSIGINNVEYRINFRKQKIEFASSGQQKLAGTLLTLVAAFYAKKINNGVIVLLDDITAKIDEKNQEYIYNVIKLVSCQTVISTIEKPLNSFALNYIKLQNLG